MTGICSLPVEAAYDRWAPFYDAYDNPMVFMASEAIRQCPDFRGRRVFEFGCGTGRNLAALGAASVAGCDLSEGMLAVARQRCPGAELFRHDMTEPPLSGVASESVDVALFSLTLEHVADLSAPLAEARRIVRPGCGRIAILEIHPFMSLGGAKAHFIDGGEEVHMPTVAHQFAGYLAAFTALDLSVERCHEWRPRDVGTLAPLKALKRGPDFPLLVEFWLRVA